MSSSAPAGRPRDPALDDAILRATCDLLIELGPAGMTVDAVARAAGTGKAAVYRRWGSKVELIVAAVRALQSETPEPDTGDLREDLIACALHYTRADPRSARVLASVLSEMTRDDELRAAASESLGRPPAAMIERVLARAVARGEVADDGRVDLIAGVLPSMAFRGVVTRSEPLDEAAAVALVDRVLLPALRA